MDDETDKSESSNSIPAWVKSIAILGLTGVICFKVISTDVSLEFDFPSFLALILALFSVGLAAMFYFKATDSSNAFYDNTYKFTREIADLLVRIESGFGEKLRHLDEAYRGMQDRFDQLPSRLQVKEVKKELQEEEEELQKILKEKEKLIENLMSKTQLRDEEKRQVLEELKSKEDALLEAGQELEYLRRKLRVANRVRRSSGRHTNAESSSFEIMHDYLRNNLVHRMDPEYLANGTPRLVQRRFARVFPALPGVLVEHMKDAELIDGDGSLTPDGIETLVKYARELS